ncbi:Dbl (DH) domain [Trinorchestia longiramus]|nr:Dbl (DH) domain [Trinorchestia longiramus]
MSHSLPKLSSASDPGGHNIFRQFEDVNYSKETAFRSVNFQESLQSPKEGKSKSIKSTNRSSNWKTKLVGKFFSGFKPSKKTKASHTLSATSRSKSNLDLRGLHKESQEIPNESSNFADKPFRRNSKFSDSWLDEWHDSALESDLSNHATLPNLPVRSHTLRKNLSCLNLNDPVLNEKVGDSRKVNHSSQWAKNKTLHSHATNNSKEFDINAEQQASPDVNYDQKCSIDGDFDEVDKSILNQSQSFPPESEENVYHDVEIEPTRKGNTISQTRAENKNEDTILTYVNSFKSSLSALPLDVRKEDDSERFRDDQKHVKEDRQSEKKLSDSKEKFFSRSMDQSLEQVSSNFEARSAETTRRNLTTQHWAEDRKINHVAKISYHQSKLMSSRVATSSPNSCFISSHSSSSGHSTRVHRSSSTDSSEISVCVLPISAVPTVCELIQDMPPVTKDHSSVFASEDTSQSYMEINLANFSPYVTGCASVSENPMLETSVPDFERNSLCPTNYDVDSVTDQPVTEYQFISSENVGASTNVGYSHSMRCEDTVKERHKHVRFCSLPDLPPYYTNTTNGSLKPSVSSANAPGTPDDIVGGKKVRYHSKPPRSFRDIPPSGNRNFPRQQRAAFKNSLEFFEMQSKQQSKRKLPTLDSFQASRKTSMDDIGNNFRKGKEIKIETFDDEVGLPQESRKLTILSQTQIYSDMHHTPWSTHSSIDDYQLDFSCSKSSIIRPVEGKNWSKSHSTAKSLQDKSSLCVGSDCRRSIGNETSGLPDGIRRVSRNALPNESVTQDVLAFKNKSSFVEQQDLSDQCSFPQDNSRNNDNIQESSVDTILRYGVVAKSSNTGRNENKKLLAHDEVNEHKRHEEINPTESPATPYKAESNTVLQRTTSYDARSPTNLSRNEDNDENENRASVFATDAYRTVSKVQREVQRAKSLYCKPRPFSTQSPETSSLKSGKSNTITSLLSQSCTAVAPALPSIVLDAPVNDRSLTRQASLPPEPFTRNMEPQFVCQSEDCIPQKNVSFLSKLSTRGDKPPKQRDDQFTNDNVQYEQFLENSKKSTDRKTSLDSLSATSHQSSKKASYEEFVASKCTDSMALAVVVSPTSRKMSPFLGRWSDDAKKTQCSPNLSAHSPQTMASERGSSQLTKKSELTLASSDPSLHRSPKSERLHRKSKGVRRHAMSNIDDKQGILRILNSNLRFNNQCPDDNLLRYQNSSNVVDEEKSNDEYSKSSDYSPNYFQRRGSRSRRYAVIYDPNTQLLPKSLQVPAQASSPASAFGFRLPTIFTKSHRNSSSSDDSSETVTWKSIDEDLDDIREMYATPKKSLSSENISITKTKTNKQAPNSSNISRKVRPLIHSKSSIELNASRSSTDISHNRIGDEQDDVLCSIHGSLLTTNESVSEEISHSIFYDVCAEETKLEKHRDVDRSACYAEHSRAPPFKSPYDALGILKGKNALHKLLGAFQYTKDPRMDALVQKLDLYSKQGIPRQPLLVPGLSSHPADEELVLEAGGWQELVGGWGELGERLRQQQSVIWELVETEATYCHKIRVITNVSVGWCVITNVSVGWCVITNLFLSCLRNLQNEQLLNDINTELLFSNIPHIYHSNLTFWKEHISVMLAEARKTKQPLDPTLLYGAFTNFNDLFKPYSLYCQQQSQCQQYCKERYQDNEHFKLYLAWCETQKECNRLRLVDILVEPMQRLTKYSLLLKAILKKTDIKEHKWKLNEMITNVECFVSNVNSALRHHHEQERLRDTIGRIEAYDAVESREEEIANKVKQYSELQLSQPMPGCPEHLSRHLLHQGDYKLRDHHTSKTDVHVFIFTDLLLVTKVTQRKAEKVKVIRPPYNIERLLEVVIGGRDSTTLGLVVLSEWGVASGAFSLQSPDTAAHRALQEAIKKAKKQYVDAQSGGRDMLEEITSGLRSPRLASSRASRGSSLAPSQSGSVDLTDPGYAYPTSPAMLEVSELRASSASSEDSVEGPKLGHHSVDVPSRPGAITQHLNVTSSQASGQSLPNLSVVSGNSHLKVPSHKNHTPWNRGVSYPPPSPRALRRSPPVPQSHHPPLIKTRHVVSTTGAVAAAAAAAQTSFALSDTRQPGQLEEEDGCRSPRRTCRSDRADNRRYYTAGAIDDIKKQDTKDSSIHKRLSWNCGQQQVPPQPALQQQIQQASASGGLCASCTSQTFVTPSNSTCSSSSSSRLTCSPSSSSRLVGQCDNRRHKLSCECVHSSSGVSSTSSLHRSITSEVETLENGDDSEDCDRTIVDLGIGECSSSTSSSGGGGCTQSPLPDYSSRFSPHISSTYICQDVTGVLSGSAQYITQVHPDGSEGEESTLSPAMVTIDVSNTCSTTPSGVQITVTEGPNPSSDASPHPTILEHDPADVTPNPGPTQRTEAGVASSNRSRGRTSVPALHGRPPPSIVPPEVPPRTSSPKLPIKRATSNPQSSASSQNPNLVNETCNNSSEKIHRSNECLGNEQLDSSNVLSEAAKIASDSFVSSESCSLPAVVRNDDSESLFRSIPKLPSISETRSINSETPNSKADESFSDTTKYFPTSDSSVSSTSSSSVSTSSSSISSPPTADSSLSSASSSSKCASNSYSSLSSVSSSTSPSKQSLSRENSGVREMLLTDSAAETSDV